MTHQIWVQFGHAAALIAATALLHGVLIVIGRKIFSPPQGREGFFALISDTVRLVLITLWLFVAHALAIALWAAVFLRVGVSPTVEEAINFAMATYTTLGFGDILAPVDWRLLTGAASANGLLLFGLSAAVLVDFTERLRRG